MNKTPRKIRKTFDKISKRLHKQMDFLTQMEGRIEALLMKRSK